MFDKYVDSDKIIKKYGQEMFDSLEPNNVRKILNIFEANKFYFIDDIITDYLDIFMVDSQIVLDHISKLKEMLGMDYVIKIGDNLELLVNSI